jgi:tRNA pseudouridine13 synthase
LFIIDYELSIPLLPYQLLTRAQKTSTLNSSLSQSVPSTIATPDENSVSSSADVDDTSNSEAGMNTTIASKDAAESKNESEASATNDDNKAHQFPVIPEDATRLAGYVGDAFKDELIALHQKIISKPDAKAAVFGQLLSPVVDDKGTRGMIHALIRRMFESRIETMSDEGNRIKCFAAPRGTTRGNKNQRSDRHQPKQNGQLNGKLGWDELGGSHLHFSLYKENKDTMEVISFLSKILRVKPSDFAFAGTKDRRAATVQRVSVFKQHAEKLAPLNRQLRNARVGNFSYEKQRLELGELAGNQFTITLRDCHFGNDEDLDEAVRINTASSIVDQAVTALQKHGFINYFGLQRFGTFETGTDEVGKLILQGNFKGAVDAILTYSEHILAKAKDVQPTDKIGRDDLQRAEAIHLFRTTGKAHEAIEKLPRRFNAEGAVIRHLGGKNKGNDYLGALGMISRNLKTMYVHAYQSFIWNMVASERWSRYGSKVIKGDLVIVDRRAEKAAALDEVDENGEVVVHPAGNEVAVNHDDIFDRARPLTAEEASSGQYSVFEIVLPTPGYDIEYPDNDIGDFYKELMASELGGGLDPADMRRGQKDFSLSGSYRKFMATIGKDFSFQVQTYKDEVEQLVETDWEKLQKSRPEKENQSGNDGFQNDAYKNGASRNGGGRGGKNNWNSGNQNVHDGKARTSNVDGEFSNNTNNMNEAAAQNRAKYEGTSQMNAWKNLPTTLPAEDKALAEAADLARALRGPDAAAPITEGKGVVSGKNGDAAIMHGKESVSVVETSDTVSVASAKDDSCGGVLLSEKHSDGLTDAKLSTLSNIVEGPRSSKVEEGKRVEQSSRIAVIVKFSLKTSQYATVALRELMRGVKTYKPDYNNGR